MPAPKACGKGELPTIVGDKGITISTAVEELHCLHVSENFQQTTAIMPPQGGKDRIVAEMQTRNKALRYGFPRIVAHRIELKAIEPFIHEKLLRPSPIVSNDLEIMELGADVQKKLPYHSIPFCALTPAW